MFQKMKDRKHAKETQETLKVFWDLVDKQVKFGENSILKHSLTNILAQSKVPVSNIHPIYLLEPLINVVARESFSPQSLALFDQACANGMTITPSALKTIIEQIGVYRRRSVDERHTDRGAGMIRLSDPAMSTQFDNSASVDQFLDLLTKHGAPWDAPAEGTGLTGTWADYLRIRPPNPRFHTDEQLQIFDLYFEKRAGAHQEEFVEVEPPSLDSSTIAQKLDQRRDETPNPFNDLIKNTYR